MDNGASHVTHRSHWQIDRKIPLALVITLLVQTGSVVWWASSTNARLNSVEEKMALAAPQGDRLTRVEVKVESALDGISEIKAILRKEPIPTKNR
jgi:hypothetical protein